MGKFFRKLWVIKTDVCERNDPSSVLWHQNSKTSTARGRNVVQIIHQYKHSSRAYLHNRNISVTSSGLFPNTSFIFCSCAFDSFC